MTEELRDPRVKVWPKSRIIMVTIVYVALATGAAWISIGVAMDRVKDMGHYQVQKTREFLGPERAAELDEFMRGEGTEEGLEEQPATDPEQTPPATEE